MLYAAPEPPTAGVYQLQYNRPKSRGAGRVAFVITPASLEKLLPLVRDRLGLPAHDVSRLPVYKPTAVHMVSPSAYRKLKEALIRSSPSALTSSQASDVLDEVLGVLKLRAPIIP